MTAEGTPSELAGVGRASPLLRAVVPLLLGGGLLLVHLEVLERGPSYAGPLLALDHLFDAVLATGAFVLLVGAGRWLLRRVGLEPPSAVDVFLYSAAVGPGIFGHLFLALGFAGLLSPLALAGAAGVGALVARGELSAMPALCGEAARELREVAGGGWLPGLALAATSSVALFLLLHGSAPPGDWDSLMYHLEVPARWLAEGRIHVPDGNLHAAYTGLFQILYLPFLALGSPAAAPLLNGLFALVLGLATFRVGQRLLGPETGLLAATVLWASTGFLLVAITARLDTTLAFYLLLGQSALALTLVDPDGARSHLYRGALVLGLAGAMKYHALAYTAALAPVGVWALWRAGTDPRARVRLLGVASALFLAGALPWMLKNLVLLGGPVYPFFTDKLFPAWIADLYGTRVVPPELESRVYGALGQAREPFDPVSLFLAPGRLTVELEGAHYHTNFLLLLLPLWIFHARRGVVAALAGPALLYLLGVGVGLSTINLRYLLLAFPALTVVTSFFAVSALRRLGRSARFRSAVLCGVAGLVLIPTVRSAWTWTTQAPVAGQALGTVSRQDYLRSAFAYYADLARTVNRSVPPDGTVLLLWEARGFYLAPDHLQDNILANWPFLRAYTERTGRCLAGSGITHVVASIGAARYYVARGTDPERVDLEGFRTFADRCLEAVEVGPAFGVYRVGEASSREDGGAGSRGEAPADVPGGS